MPHRLSLLDEGPEHGTCELCGPVEVVLVNAGRRAGVIVVCGNAYRERQGEKRWRYKHRHRIAVQERLDLGICERCGFVAEDPCQLDVDHIVPKWRGGAVSDPDNLQILCANCHRLKSKLEGSGPNGAHSKYL